MRSTKFQGLRPGRSTSHAAERCKIKLWPFGQAEKKTTGKLNEPIVDEPSATPRQPQGDMIRVWKMNLS
jgi:hypothetical protein